MLRQSCTSRLTFTGFVSAWAGTYINVNICFFQVKFHPSDTAHTSDPKPCNRQPGAQPVDGRDPAAPRSQA
ncbi:hypothetical protein BV25DRAFT_336546 [Artomyces pyxidatus]|uniref:Uncharacterized protein n=1 Tax=Artomyces pyxidatus TaxID=48021 RepID=A0ACB8T7E3_9AGAM|nr:hypothetical protein BV25DRAFT_336546 [Artomyces pyxidatus]